ncbi:hypothetical protein GCK72_013199 [Caenorhabditis remanei]|uniref:Uncharacterized protein n=1 Tax=Caenorhabditis remanei TaxID=31234 RepID=A0A6A5GQE2_CAERE|nr:hypothetical protein GCK72_013199 [Caenorhabditis remanei]KAF1756745.1 hypothetical protein GCK72_013199 [Caenorhabditis remanei]
MSRCKRLKWHEPNLQWESIGEIEKELKGYQRVEQFDEFWKRLREMESRISRIESRIHNGDFGEYLQETWDTVKKPFVFAKSCICNRLKRASSKEASQ